jgi:hypothetical protein
VSSIYLSHLADFRSAVSNSFSSKCSITIFPVTGHCVSHCHTLLYWQNIPSKWKCVVVKRMSSNSITSSACKGERSGKENSLPSLFLMACRTSPLVSWWLGGERQNLKDSLYFGEWDPVLTWKKYKESIHMSLIDHPIIQPSLAIFSIWTPITAAEARKIQLSIQCKLSGENVFFVLLQYREFSSLVKTSILIVL